MAVQISKTVGLKFTTCETTLKIENVKTLFQMNSFGDLVFKSVDFNSGVDDENVWCLHVRLGSGKVDVAITNSTKSKSREASVSVSVVCSRGTRHCTKTLPNASYNKESYNFVNYTTYQNVLQYNASYPNLLLKGDLILHCKVTTLLTYNGSAKEFKVPANNPEKEFAAMLHDGKFSDVVIVVDGNEIKAHKIMLAMRSPVFAAMFESDIKEALQNRVVISDLDYEVAQEMLHFIYTGTTVTKLSRMADRLLMAADKYSLVALKAMCEKELYKTVSVNTAMELLALADLHNAAQLKEKAGEFIKENVK